MEIRRLDPKTTGELEAYYDRSGGIRPKALQEGCEEGDVIPPRGGVLFNLAFFYEASGSLVPGPLQKEIE